MHKTSYPDSPKLTKITLICSPFEKFTKTVGKVKFSSFRAVYLCLVVYGNVFKFLLALFQLFQTIFPGFYLHEKTKRPFFCIFSENWKGRPKNRIWLFFAQKAHSAKFMEHVHVKVVVKRLLVSSLRIWTAFLAFFEIIWRFSYSVLESSLRGHPAIFLGMF